jgi:hypothetical protein
VKLTTNLLPSAEAKHNGAIPPLPHMSSLRRAELIKHKDTFTFKCPLDVHVFSV